MILQYDKPDIRYGCKYRTNSQHLSGIVFPTEHINTKTTDKKQGKKACKSCKIRHITFIRKQHSLIAEYGTKKALRRSCQWSKAVISHMNLSCKDTHSKRFGIGLESIKDIIEKHNGNLDIYPKETVFRVGITLPLK